MLQSASMSMGFLNNAACQKDDRRFFRRMCPLPHGISTASAFDKPRWSEKMKICHSTESGEIACIQEMNHS
jgi:hypothetical protein